MNTEIQNIIDKEKVNLSSINKRANAFFIDEMLLSFLLVISLWDSFSNVSTLEEVVILTNKFILEYMFIKIIYQAFFVMKYGASLGKIVMKIRVIEIRTLQNPSVVSSLNRAIFRIISESFFYLGFLWGFFDKFKQTLHDKTAKTIVIDV